MKKFFLRCLLPLVLAFAAAGADAAVRKPDARAMRLKFPRLRTAGRSG